MSKSIEDTISHLDNRSGYKVVNYREFGLPVFYMSSILTLQDESDIGPIEHFILKCISIGLNEISSIRNFLGLPNNIIDKQIGSLIYDGIISSQNSSFIGPFNLTGKGKERLNVAKSTTINKEQINLYIDGITRDVLTINNSELYNGRELANQGIGMLHPIPRHSPRLAELDIIEINQMLDNFSNSGKIKRKALRVDALTGRNRLFFRKALVIAYKSDNSRNISISFAIDGRISNEHEIAYSRSEDGQRSKVFGPLFDSKKRRRELQYVTKFVRENIPAVYKKVEDTSGVHTLSIKRDRILEDTPSPSIVRSLKVYEYPPYLNKAFNDANSRIFIRSPWIRAGVVNKDFIEKLTLALSRGVNVHIEYSRIDRNANKIDIESRKALEGLTKAFDNFKFQISDNTSVKVLLVDNLFFVVSSFSWLSYKGDHSYPFREEWGRHVEGTDLVENFYVRLLS